MTSAPPRTRSASTSATCAARPRRPASRGCCTRSAAWATCCASSHDPAPAPDADVRPGGGRDGRAGVARLLPGDAQRAARAGRPPAARAGRAGAAASAPCAAARCRRHRGGPGGPAEFSQVVGARRRACAIAWAGWRSRSSAAIGRRPGGGGDPFLSDRTADGVHLRVMTVPIEGLGAVQLGRSLESVDAVLGRLRIVLVLLVLVGTAFAAAMARPVRAAGHPAHQRAHARGRAHRGHRRPGAAHRRARRGRGRPDGAALRRDARSRAGLAGRPAPAGGRRLARAAHAGDRAADQHGGDARRRRARGGRAARAAARHGRAVRGAQRARGRPHRAGPRRRGRPADRGHGPRRARGRGGGASAAPRAGGALPHRARAVRDRRRARPTRPRGQQRPRQRRARTARPAAWSRSRCATACSRSATTVRASPEDELGQLFDRFFRGASGARAGRARASGWPSCGRSPRPTERPFRRPTRRAAGWSSGSPSRRCRPRRRGARCVRVA